ncbi:hypothetical protein BJ875DRAFT_425122 [Amylocarpus encephaloides]|uniref:Uncharacterized protein n=1 Tax=Amylocarpus encephaloides TaxID=45428 RepID=A0A9P7YIT6_9HELO|nr:hypothetical protein BJ875DRAFT_425122 [Amylocarpus encephaloides]
MFPPIDDAILKSNPKFAALHANLTTNNLNPNGSTKNRPSRKERVDVAPALTEARIRSAKSQLILTALKNIELSTSSSRKPSKAQPRPSPQPLPTKIIEIILLLTSRLSNPNLPPSQIKLLESTPQWQSLETHLPYISTLLSTYLQSQASALTRILSPTTNPSYLHRSIPKLHHGITSLQSTISNKRLTLQTQRQALITLTTTLLQRYNYATTLTIQLLETSKHGSLSLERHYLTKMSHLALTVDKLSLDAREKSVKGSNMVYTPQVVAALTRYFENLRDGRERLKERKRDAERVLWGYGVGREEGEKEKVMREVARVYGELMREMRDVEKDVDRLRGR